MTGSISRSAVLCGVSFNWTAFNSLSENLCIFPTIQEVENACMHLHIIAINCDI